ncbi:MAG: uracil-DNA glycosylase [Minisyncoccia bacterium]
MKFTNLNKLQIYYDNACKCELKKTAKQAVFGNGNPKAQVVFIGEAPGKKEDETGVPFIGTAGKFLDTMLQSIKLSRADIYITNTVKYRPPENRDPTPIEKQQCRDWLIAELNYIKPDLIVFLGRHAMNSFFPELSISDAHGKIINKAKYIDTKNSKKTSSTKNNSKEQKTNSNTEDNTLLLSKIKTANFLPLYHPAAALYNGNMRITLLKDFKQVHKLLKKISEK